MDMGNYWTVRPFDTSMTTKLPNKCSHEVLCIGFFSTMKFMNFASENEKIRTKHRLLLIISKNSLW